MVAAAVLGASVLGATHEAMAAPTATELGEVPANSSVSRTTNRSFLGPNESLAAGASITSPSGRFWLTLEHGGNVVLYDKDGTATLLSTPGAVEWAADLGIGYTAVPIALWDSRTVGTAATSLSMGLDGDLALRGSPLAAPGEPVWHTRTAGRPGVVLRVRDDGTVTVGYPGGQVLWTVGTSTPKVQLAAVKHVVYGRSAQRVWMFEADGSLFDTYPVSGKSTSPAPGNHIVFSKSKKAWSLDGGLTMEHMVRFAHGARGIAIGFHAIPRNHAGTPAQSVHELGQFLSGGCVRQQDGKAHQLYDWAPIGTPIVVIA